MMDTREVLRIDDRQKLIFIDERPVRLSHMELDLPCLLASDPGRVFSNQEILDTLWPGRDRASAGDVRQSIYLLRKRIEDDPRSPTRVVTIKGFGYQLVISVKR